MSDSSQSACGTERIRTRRAANHLRPDADLSECYCCGANPDQLHHTSYDPEKTIPVCSTCHATIHDSSEEYDELTPKKSRPDNYESRRRFEQRRNNKPKKGVCDTCGGEFVPAELYALELSWNTVQRRLGKVSLRQMPTSIRCYECMGNNRPVDTGSDQGGNQ